MRARNIKPGFFCDDDLAECSIPARMLFVGLWCLADREGRLEDRPKRIKMNIFPADAIECEPLLDELARQGKIRRYVVDGTALIDIPCFAKHQKPHQNEKPSELPAFPGDGAALDEALAGREQNTCDLGAKCLQPRLEELPTLALPTRADSLNPDSLNPDSASPKRTRADAREPSPLPEPKQDGGKQSAKAVAFEAFWAAYPAKKAKKAASRAWDKLSPDVRELCVAAIRAQVEAGHFTGSDGRDFVPNPATWLNGGRWEDEIAPRVQARASPMGVSVRMLDQARAHFQRHGEDGVRAFCDANRLDFQEVLKRVAT